MKARHTHNAKDAALLKHIYQEVEEKLVINKKSFLLHIWLKFAFYFILTTMCYFQLFLVEGEVNFVLSYMLYGFVSVLFAFNFSHDFSHNTIFKSKRLNHICFTLIYTLVGAHAEAWKQRHVNSHHFAPNVEGYDSDLEITKLIRVLDSSEHMWYHKFQHIYAPIAYTSYSLFWIFIKDFVILFSDDEYTDKKGLKYHLSFWTQKISYIHIILVLPLLFAAQHWSIILLGFFFMHLSQSLFLLFTFFMTHHVEKTHYPTTDDQGNISTSWFMNQMQSSNDMHPFSLTANFILGGFNNHIAHHLFPHIHHIHYPKLNKILYQILEANDIQPNQTSYIGGIVSHIRLLKRLGSNKTANKLATT